MPLPDWTPNGLRQELIDARDKNVRDNDLRQTEYSRVAFTQWKTDKSGVGAMCEAVDPWGDFDWNVTLRVVDITMGFEAMSTVMAYMVYDADEDIVANGHVYRGPIDVIATELAEHAALTHIRAIGT